jgi:hypothetical protein
MRFKTLFRVLLKLIGVWIFIQGSAAVIQAGAWLVQVVIQPGSFMPDMNPWLIGSLVAGLLQVALGLYFFFGGAWVVNRAIPANRPYCPECGYDLTRNGRPNCPECGTLLPHAAAP